jgi:hypothetical protein
MPARPNEVFAVLADGWSYANWVVGTAHVRDVDANWPDPGAQLHHQSAGWPLRLKDTTTVVSCRPNEQLVLEAGLWPLGQLRVDIQITGVPSGSLVTIEESVSEGPLRGIRRAVDDVLLYLRNREALRRLGDIVASRSTAAP